jgi:hypothetical protein
LFFSPKVIQSRKRVGRVLRETHRGRDQHRQPTFQELCTADVTLADLGVRLRAVDGSHDHGRAENIDRSDKPGSTIYR